MTFAICHFERSEKSFLFPKWGNRPWLAPTLNPELAPFFSRVAVAAFKNFGQRLLEVRWLFELRVLSGV
jgi:hypothetical protein